LFADILQSIILLLGWLQLNEKSEQAQGKTCNSCNTFAESKHEQEAEADGKSQAKKAIYFAPAAAGQERVQSVAISRCNQRE
jgi:hypothetical protein